jgi:hypothetical protein
MTFLDRSQKSLKPLRSVFLSRFGGKELNPISFLLSGKQGTSRGTATTMKEAKIPTASFSSC